MSSRQKYTKMLATFWRHAFDKYIEPIIFDFEDDWGDLSLVKGTPVLGTPDNLVSGFF